MPRYFTCLIAGLVQITAVCVDGVAKGRMSCDGGGSTYCGSGRRINLHTIYCTSPTPSGTVVVRNLRSGSFCHLGGCTRVCNHSATRPNRSALPKSREHKASEDAALWESTCLPGGDPAASTKIDTKYIPPQTNVRAVPTSPRQSCGHTVAPLPIFA